MYGNATNSRSGSTGSSAGRSPADTIDGESVVHRLKVIVSARTNRLEVTAAAPSRIRESLQPNATKTASQIGRTGADTAATSGRGDVQSCSPKGSRAGQSSRRSNGLVERNDAAALHAQQEGSLPRVAVVRGSDVTPDWRRGSRARSPRRRGRRRRESRPAASWTSTRFAASERARGEDVRNSRREVGRVAIHEVGDERVAGSAGGRALPSRRCPDVASGRAAARSSCTQLDESRAAARRSRRGRRAAARRARPCRAHRG